MLGPGVPQGSAEVSAAASSLAHLVHFGQILDGLLLSLSLLGPHAKVVSVVWGAGPLLLCESGGKDINLGLS